jgi:hypothetical protein
MKRASTPTMNQDQLIDWLLQGDVSIQYQVWRDLLGQEKKGLQDRIAREGWGRSFLLKRRSDGHWGDRLYQPKWTSTFYTLLDLRNLNLSPQHEVAQETIDLVLRSGKAEDGGIPLGPSTTRFSDVCVNAMFLNYASYFRTDERALHSIVDAILQERMADGGFNCRTTRSGARHSSLHTTLSVLEGLTEFQKAGYSHQQQRIRRARESALEFILLHRLFLSDRTGQVISKDLLKMTYPCRWRYDILRAMDYFHYAGVKWDDRMHAALEVLQNKRNRDGTWNMNAAHAGQVHFTMEQAGRPSRWNTLRMLRVLRSYT